MSRPIVPVCKQCRRVGVTVMTAGMCTRCLEETNTMMDTLYKVEALIRKVTGAPYTLAGGCVRDASVGVTPKDYDAVLCCGEMESAEAFALLADHVMQFRRMLDANVGIYMAYGQGRGEVCDGFAERLYACGKVKLPNGYEIDLLLDKATNMADAISGYDCNMNQVYLTVSGPSQAFPKELIFTEGRITGEARGTYMREKFAKLTNKEI